MKPSDWGRYHAARDIGKLTGSNAQNVIKLHGVQLRGARRVLDVGVGMHQMAKHLFEQHVDVVGLDVCDAAFVGYPPGDCHLLSSEPPEGICDLAICHLVMQHCTNEQVYETLDWIRPALMVNGSLHVQFAEPLPAWQPPGDVDVLFLHTPGQIEQFLAVSGYGRIERWEKKDWNNEHQLRWHMIKAPRQ